MADLESCGRCFSGRWAIIVWDSPWVVVPRRRRGHAVQLYVSSVAASGSSPHTVLWSRCALWHAYFVLLPPCIV